MCSVTSLTGLVKCLCHLPWRIFLALATFDSTGSGLSDLDFASLVRTAANLLVLGLAGATVFLTGAGEVLTGMDVVVERTTFLVDDGLETVRSAVAFTSGSE